MSILTKPYEISIWDDAWNLEEKRFEEKKIQIIGSNTMESQTKAFSPNFTRNINGSKSLTFQLYAKYVNNLTGEWEDNPYVEELNSERKVKLKYDGKWHDFIIKNIKQDSANYLYTYELSDAIVNELSKNGFGVTFDQVLNNNIGTAAELAQKALQDTDWTIADDSETIVQTVEESLVWIQLTGNTVGQDLLATQIFDQSDLREGVIEADNKTTLATYTPILAFYSSCVNKPHRFQFIYIEDLNNIVKNEDRIIQNSDCQYYIDFETPETNYVQCNTIGYEHLYLPEGFELLGTIPNNDTVISYLYRGARYGYAMQGEYVPVLNKYVNLYSKDGDQYYGYTESEYISPITVKNYVTNPVVENISGWIGTKLDGGEQSAKIELVYGRFENNKFISCADDVVGKTEEYASYLKVETTGPNQVVLNSGPYDNRYDIKYLTPNVDTLILSNVEVYNDAGSLLNVLEYFNLGEYIYSSNKLAYVEKEEKEIDFEVTITGTRKEFKTLTNNYENTKNFTKQSKLRICFNPGVPGVYYIKQCYLYKKVLNNGEIILPIELSYNEEASSIIGTINRKYHYINKNNFLEAKYVSKEEIIIDDTQEVQSYTSYKPVYNTGAEKVRSITIAESNYFNILSTISETFGAWLDIKVGHNPDGTISTREIAFRNYAGKENYAGFRYGVNLQNIERTFESKQLVTKLIVKANSNELAENGFCTIQRAASNETGENYLYDFSYYHKQGLLSEESFLPIVLSDFTENEEELTLNGYYTRIKDINNKILDKNGQISGLKTDLVIEKSEFETAEYELEAVEQTIEQVVSDYEVLTGCTPLEKAFHDDQIILSSDSYTTDDYNNLPGVFVKLTNINDGRFQCRSNKDTLEGKFSFDYFIENLMPWKAATGEDLGFTKPSAFDGSLWEWLDFHDPSSRQEINKKEIENELKSCSSRQYSFQNYVITIPGTDIDGDASFQCSFNAVLNQNQTKKITSPLISLYPDPNKDFQINIAVLSFYNRIYIFYNILDADNQICYYQKTINDTLKDYEIFNSIEAKKLVTQYYQALSAKQSASEQKTKAQTAKEQIESSIQYLEEAIEDLKSIKSSYNKLFYKTYSRFIQEGTWISEDYIDDEKYYVDSQSVLYNSCFPQVAYSINTIEVSQLEGYEDFVFELGDKTFVEDYDFFGADYKEDVVVTSISEILDNPKNNKITLQNYKNQFQDLFQKITATVQQTQYSTGSYKKAAALANANSEKKQEFLSDAMDTSGATLIIAGQSDVVQDSTGITITKKNDKTKQLKLIGGEILFSKETPDGLHWVTGINADGISASHINVGTLDTNAIRIMNGADPAFTWDVGGISAYSIANDKINYRKFVRFDKYGLYGIDNTVSSDWIASNLTEVNDKATFALTWEGLKVANESTVLKIGRESNNILSVIANEKEIFNITSMGTKMSGWVLNEKYLENKSQSVRIWSDGETLLEVGTFSEGEKINKEIREAVDERTSDKYTYYGATFSATNIELISVKEALKIKGISYKGTNLWGEGAQPTKKIEFEEGIPIRSGTVFTYNIEANERTTLIMSGTTLGTGLRITADGDIKLGTGGSEVSIRDLLLDSN